MSPLLLTFLACGKGEPEPLDLSVCDQVGAEDHTVVLDSLVFGRIEEGTSPGFDLDDATSILNGLDGCGVPDLTDPDGAVGIDNGFGGLLPALELTEAAAVEDLIAQTITDGELLITFDLADLDDATGDGCIDVTVGRAAGTPMLGTDGQLLDGQTLDRDPAIDPVRIEHVAVVDGTFEAPFEITIPVQIFDVDMDFTLKNGRIRGTIAPDGTVSGIFAGGVDVATMLAITEENNVDPALHDVLAALLSIWADLEPDGLGGCEQVSIVFEYSSVKMFWFE
ncbi:MAG: hypothetical protein H6735_01475 [Alphaproteobacteria bacterium]|nr:hypothetical protein [Alphaproteobacteria bacterium]